MYVRLTVNLPQVLMASPAPKQHGNQELTHGRDRPVGLKRTQAFFRLPGSRDTYVDAVCSYANPVTYRGCDSTAGTVAEWKARKKNAEHPVFDAQNHRRLHPFDFRALSFERHGYWAKETVGFTKN